MVATAGLCNFVNIYNKHPNLKKFKPWVALLYVHERFRNKGFGKMLLKYIENCSKEIGFDRIYLYTFTSELFYKKNGWIEINRVEYKNTDTVVMNKNL